MVHYIVNYTSQDEYNVYVPRSVAELSLYLKNEITNYEDYIEKLSSYMASTGKSYKNHLATIRNWARKDKEKPIKKTTSNTKRVVIDEEEQKLNEQILRMLGEN